MEIMSPLLCIFDGTYFRVRRVLMVFGPFQHHVVAGSNYSISFYYHAAMPVKHIRLEGTFNGRLNKDKMLFHVLNIDFLH